MNAYPPSSLPLVRLSRATVYRQGRMALSDISFSLTPGQSWMVLGPNGAGKSTFLALLRGDLWPVQTAEGTGRLFQVNGRWQASPLGWREKTAIVSPELEQRYRRLSRTLSCARVIAAGLHGSLCPTTPLSEAEQRNVLEKGSAFGLQDLLQRPFATLSQGEAQKTLIIRALMQNPQVLFLDEVCTGLDPDSRQEVLDLLSRLVATGVQIVASTHRREDLAPCLDREVVLEHGTIVRSGPVSRDAAPRPVPILDTRVQPSTPETAPRITLEEACVAVHGQTLLGPVSWTVHAGEHWLIQGANGSGKTTLLKLIAGEVPACLGGRIHRFPPLDGQSIQELRTRIGFFGPELITAHHRSQTGLQAVLSGLRGQIGPRDVFTEPEREQALRWMEALDIADLADEYVLHLSTGQLRRVLLTRAVVHSPCMLLLDEPCAGLDPRSRAEFLHALDKLAGQGVQILLVSHRAEDVFPAVNRRLILEQGRIKHQCYLLMGAKCSVSYAPMSSSPADGGTRA